MIFRLGAESADEVFYRRFPEDRKGWNFHQEVPGAVVAASDLRYGITGGDFPGFCFVIFLLLGAAEISGFLSQRGNVNVKNDTVDLYRFFDCTDAAEFLYRCVAEAIEKDVPLEIDYLKRHDKAMQQIIGCDRNA